jgi:hypothetical protein
MQNLDTNKAKDSVSNDAAADSAHAASQYPNDAEDAGNLHQKKIIKKIVCRQTEHLTTSFSSRSIVVI